jgi:uncharacterized protein
MTVMRLGGTRTAFVDTSAFYALTDAHDQNHPAARTIITRLADEEFRLFTSNLVLAETHALLLARLGRSVASLVLQEIDRSSARVVRASVLDEQRGRDIIYRHEDKDFSLTDAISFAIIERMGIAHAFAFDRHFEQYGVEMF